MISYQAAAAPYCLGIKIFLLKSILLYYRYEYHWADGQAIKRPIKCSAPKYIDYLMSWVQDQLDDETLFPSKIGKYCWLSWNICHMKLSWSWPKLYLAAKEWANDLKLCIFNNKHKAETSFNSLGWLHLSQGPFSTPINGVAWDPRICGSLPSVQTVVVSYEKCLTIVPSLQSSITYILSFQLFVS